MLDMARKAVGKTQAISRAEYDADENLRLALIHLIQTIGEAARRISPEFCKSHPDVRWADIVGMRHKVVHDYLGVDEDVVWRVDGRPPRVARRARANRSAWPGRMTFAFGETRGLSVV